MKYGYFDDANREYVITRPDTPAPWANYLGSPEYGALISNNAGGYSFAKSGANGRILRYVFNQFDRPGRYLYLRDNENGDYWFVVHSGSRHLGLEVANHWQKIAKQKHPDLPANLAYLEGDDMEGYLNDMKWAQEFAMWNREAMLDAIIRAFKLKKDVVEKFCTVHNYIDLDLRIVRKGSISLQKDEIALIPINMAYGSLIVKGKGNPDWNFSGPHGAGRVLSRRAARETLKMEDFKQSMKGIYTTSVSSATIDESPMAYKPPQTIIENIGETCEIVNRIKPVWNVKAGADE